jgi:hypothetical protein
MVALDCPNCEIGRDTGQSVDLHYKAISMV